LSRGLSAVLAFLLLANAQAQVAQAQVAPMLNLVVIEGDGAINNIRQRTAREPIVQVQDENRKPVAGAIVTFTLPSRGASGVFGNGTQTLTVTTDQQGQAVARGLRPNTVKGQMQIRVNASFQGRTAVTTITQTNAIVAAVAGTATGGAISGKLIAVLAVVGAAAAGGAVYATTRGGNNAPAAPPTTISPGGGSVGAPR
jgi:hypothetical protein